MLSLKGTFSGALGQLSSLFGFPSGEQGQQSDQFFERLGQLKSVVATVSSIGTSAMPLFTCAVAVITLFMWLCQFSFHDMEHTWMSAVQFPQTGRVRAMQQTRWHIVKGTDCSCVDNGVFP